MGRSVAHVDACRQGRGVKNPIFFVDVINEWPLSMCRYCMDSVIGNELLVYTPFSLTLSGVMSARSIKLTPHNTRSAVNIPIILIFMLNSDCFRLSILYTTWFACCFIMLVATMNSC